MIAEIKVWLTHILSFLKVDCEPRAWLWQMWIMGRFHPHNYPKIQLQYINIFDNLNQIERNAP